MTFSLGAQETPAQLERVKALGGNHNSPLMAPGTSCWTRSSSLDGRGRRQAKRWHNPTWTGSLGTCLKAFNYGVIRRESCDPHPAILRASPAGRWPSWSLSLRTKLQLQYMRSIRWRLVASPHKILIARARDRPPGSRIIILGAALLGQRYPIREARSFCSGTWQGY